MRKRALRLLEGPLQLRPPPMAAVPQIRAQDANLAKTAHPERDHQAR